MTVVSAAHISASTAPDMLARIDTPCPVIDMNVVERNIDRLQAACDAAGVMNRPHFKAHKSLAIARLQYARGARGMTCQTIGEAEVLADAGFDDILISYNIIGAAKYPRLVALADRVSLKISCDNRTVADGLSEGVHACTERLDVLVECDTGRQRCGVSTPEDAADLARYIDALPGLHFVGFLTYPPRGPVGETAGFVATATTLCRSYGLTVDVVSAGGTPNIVRIGDVGETEYRGGTYIYNDRQMICEDAASMEDCAYFVHATVVSRPSQERVMIDAGSKSLTGELGYFDDFGVLPEYPKARLYRMAEEHGFVDVSGCERTPAVGEVVRVLPNHVCPAVNLFDHAVMIRDGKPAGMLAIEARGRVA